MPTTQTRLQAFRTRSTTRTLGQGTRKWTAGTSAADAKIHSHITGVTIRL